jgi:hypothetical protein
LVSGLSVPAGKTLECSGATLKYTGATIAITLAGGGRVENCILAKQGTLGAIGIQISNTGSAGVIERNTISNFSKGVYLHGSVGVGVYFIVIRDNYFAANTIGIDSDYSGGATVNSVTIQGNVVHDSNIAFNVCSGCAGWAFISNDVEFPVGANAIEYNILGYGNTLLSNWVEYNVLGSATGVIGLKVTGTKNVLLGNQIPQGDTTNWTAKSIAAGNAVLNLHDTVGGDIQFPGTVNVAGFLQGSSNFPVPDVTACTGASISTGSTNLAGKFTGLPSGACTIVLAMRDATAAHGWSCAVNNQTTANLFRQTASTRSTVTISGTSASGDVLAYGPCAAW